MVTVAWASWLLSWETFTLVRTVSFVQWYKCICSQESSYVLSAGGGLRKALHLRSYRQEIIVMVSDVQRLDSFLQAADSLQQLGLSNILLLSYSQDMCETIAPILPDIGCGWS